jgi:hypothetical protein
MLLLGFVLFRGWGKHQGKVDIQLFEQAVASESELEDVAPPPPPPPPPEPVTEVLPTTAGPLPWLALFGALFLVLGGALRWSRKQS